MPQSLERAVAVSRTRDLARHLKKGAYARVYFGVEFCESLIPGRGDLTRALRMVRALGIPLTLLTPYVTDEGLRRLDPLLDIMAQQEGGAEVVVNDLGVLEAVRVRGSALRPLFGRLMTRQKRDPRIDGVAQLEDRRMMREHCLTSAEFVEWSQALGVSRFEFDNLPMEGAIPPGIGLSVYFPYVFLTTSRRCIHAPCSECRKLEFSLRSPLLPNELVLKGRSQFYENRADDHLRNGLFDRVVFQWEVPH